MSALIDRIRSGHPITADGAMGTMLQQLCKESFSCPEELNITRPEIIKQVTESYLEAGAELIQTNTFGGSPLRLAQFGLESKAEIINRIAAEIARIGVVDKAWIAGSVGPCGRYLEPFGDLNADEFRESCVVQVKALIKGGVDAFVIETVMDVEEGVLAVEVVKSISSEIPVMISATFKKSPTGYSTLFGTSLTETIRRFVSAGADVVGSNCGAGMDMMIDVAREIRIATTLPVMIRPNAGLPEVIDGFTIWRETPDRFAEGTRQLLDLGVFIIGGCCGTTPEYIRRIREVVDRFDKN